MVSFKLIVAPILAFCALAQSQQFYIQNWGNGNSGTNYTYQSLAAGRFTVDWLLTSGGNFVVGKGQPYMQDLHSIRTLT
jgi:endo-1,4-beta-xylanase